jgi:DNA-binding NtrC family response regulator
MSARESHGKKRILVADDNVGFSEEIRLVLEGEYEVRTCPLAEKALEIHAEGWPDLILMDVEFPGMDGIRALGEIRKTDKATPVIILTVHEDIGAVVEAMRLGAYHYVSKVQGPDILLETMRAALRSSDVERSRRYLDRRLEESRGGGRLILGPADSSQALLREIEQAAGADVSVLILGETGTGKEIVAREIHERSARSSRPFVPVDVASLPETLVESSLFGHEKGAFTGATAMQCGAFEAADGGTVFLDEIGEIPLTLQARLLRVLQERAFRRLGGFNRPETKVDVRIVASTNRDLAQMAEAGDFRSDLFYRLNVMRIDVPPLKERLEDLPLLARHFVEKHHVATGSLVTGVSEEAVRAYQRRDWPGNIRELENAIVSAMVRSEDAVLGAASDIPQAAISEAPATLPYAIAKDRALMEFKKAYLQRILSEAGGIVNQAAKLAGLSQSSFRKMMKDVGIKGRE